MMKCWLSVILVLLLLSGCAVLPGENQPVTDSPPGTSETAPVPTPAGCYEPDSELERITNGAVRVYKPDQQDIYHMTPMGSDLLLFSGMYTTRLTKLSGDDLYVAREVYLHCYVSPYNSTVRVRDNGVTYYDDVKQDLVYLDADLREVSRVSLPKNILGFPALSEDCRFLFYCTSQELRCMDLEMGLDRLVKEMSNTYQEITGVHLSGTVLECSISDESSNWYTVFLSAKTGELLWKAQDPISLFSNSSRYYATHYDGQYRELLTGEVGSDPSMLHYDDLNSNAEPLMERNALLLVSSSEAQNATRLDYYDLISGTRRYSLEVPANLNFWCYCSNADSDIVWCLRYDLRTNRDIICRWDLSKSQIQDDGVYLGDRRTSENPDLDGISRCRQRADRMSEKYGVEILIWDDALRYEPWDYEIMPEHRVPLIQEELDLLEIALSRYPDGFMKLAASETTNGVIHISLVRSIHGKADANVIDSAVGLQYWDEQGTPYIALALGYSAEQDIHHELFHFIENRVLIKSTQYDNWESLNPAGFSYDYSYTANANRVDYSYTDGKDRAFIDVYSMSYPKEDRARIMENAITEGNADCFRSPIMQAKLKRICLGIREAFGLKKSSESYPWEQYLDTPLAYTKK